MYIANPSFRPRRHLDIVFLSARHWKIRSVPAARACASVLVLAKLSWFPPEPSLVVYSSYVNCFVEETLYAGRV
jgi:hypothetical protein